MIVPLGDLAPARAGHPFRGSVPLAPEGNASVIQMRDLSPDGAVAWSGLVRTQIPPGKRPDWLRDTDVLFVARGGRNYAVCLAGVPARTLCSQHFFVLRCNQGRLLPQYLAWHINRAPSQRYLASNAEGSAQLSIRRGVLEAMPIAVPPLERQRQLVELAATAARERRCLESLIDNRELQLDALADALLSPPNRAP